MTLDSSQTKMAHMSAHAKHFCQSYDMINKPEVRGTPDHWGTPYVLKRPFSQTLVCEILELLREFLLYRCGTSLSVVDLTIQVPRDVPISVEYSLLDLLFLCHAFRKENLFLFKDQDRILSLVVGTPRPIEQLSYQGEGLLAR